MSTRLRLACGVLGVAMGLYGALRLFDLGWANTRATLTWLIGGVVLHDGAFAGLTLAVAIVAVRLVPRERLAPVVVALVILVPTTLLAIPELGRFGARADNATLLDRHYWLGWFGLVAMVLAGVLVGILVTSHSGRGRPGRPAAVAAGPEEAAEGGDDGEGPGRR